MESTGIVARSVRLLLVVAVCFATPSSRAGRNAALIEDAQAAFANLDLEGAMRILETALTNPGNDPGDLVRIYSLRAQCLIPLGRESDALDDFRKALSIDPEFRLGPDVSPVYTGPFMQVLDEGVSPLEVQIVPPASVATGDRVRVTARVVSDTIALVDHVRFHYRRQGNTRYTRLRVRVAGKKSVRFHLPTGLWAQANDKPLEWFAQVRDRYGGVLRTIEHPDRPARVAVVPKWKNPLGSPLVRQVEKKPLTKTPVVSRASETAWYERWWVWALVGGAAAAVGGTVWAVTSTGGASSHRDFAVEIQ
jgi:hypothetical protein